MPGSNIDHVGISAPKDQFDSIVEWYKVALAPLNYTEIMRIPGAVGLGYEIPDFWISEKESSSPQEIHFAFMAPDHDTVNAFHKAALTAGGTCNGPQEYDQSTMRIIMELLFWIRSKIMWNLLIIPHTKKSTVNVDVFKVPRPAVS